MLSEARTRIVYAKAIEQLVADLVLAKAKPDLIERVRTSGVGGLSRMRAGSLRPDLWNRLVQDIAMAQALEIVLEIKPV